MIVGSLCGLIACAVAVVCGAVAIAAPYAAPATMLKDLLLLAAGVVLVLKGGGR